MKRVFTYGVNVCVASELNEVISFIEDLGLKVNENTIENIKGAFGELEHNCYDWYFVSKTGYKVSSLKPVGIGQGTIKFEPTEFNTKEEYLADKQSRLEKYTTLSESIRSAAEEVAEKKDDIRNVSIRKNFDAITPELSVTIEWNGYWSDALKMNCYLNSCTMHINMNTLKTDNGQDIFEQLNSMK